MNIAIALLIALAMLVIAGILVGACAGAVTFFEKYPKSMLDFFVRCPKCSGRKTVLIMTYHYEDREHGDKDAWNGLCCHCGRIHDGIVPMR